MKRKLALVAGVLLIPVIVMGATLILRRDPICDAAKDSVLRYLRTPATADIQSCESVEVEYDWIDDYCNEWPLGITQPRFCVLWGKEHEDVPSYHATVKVDAQNLYGAVVRETYIVEVRELPGGDLDTMILR